MFKCTKSLPKNKHFVIATFPIQFSSSVVNETSNLIQREANILAALLLSQDHNANQLNCRDMSGGLLEGYFLGGRKITEFSENLTQRKKRAQADDRLIGEGPHGAVFPTFVLALSLLLSSVYT